MTEASPQRANMGLIAAIVARRDDRRLSVRLRQRRRQRHPGGADQESACPGAGRCNGLGFTVGSLLIGCFVGAFFAGRLADLMGRRNVMMIAAVLFLIGALVQGFATIKCSSSSPGSRGGMAVGAASVLSPAYISEVAPASIRGRLTTVQQIMIITGLTAAFLVNYFLAAVGGRCRPNSFWLGLEAWRWMYLMQAMPAAVFLVALFFIPESPRYLVSKGRDEQATGVLTSLFGAEVARAKLEEIRATFSEDHRPRLRDIMKPTAAAFRPIVWAGIMLAVFQQLVGINVIFYYGATLWQLAGFTEDQSLADQHRVGRGFDRGLLRHHRCHRQDRSQAAAVDRLGGHGGRPCSRWSMPSANGTLDRDAATSM